MRTCSSEVQLLSIKRRSQEQHSAGPQTGRHDDQVSAASSADHRHQSGPDHYEPSVRLLEVTKPSSSACGFHLTRTKWDPYPWISAVDAHSPAERSGLKVGDCVLEVNGADVLGMRIAEIAQLLKGTKQHVTLLLWSSGCNADCDPESLCHGPMPRSLQRLSTVVQAVLAIIECPVCLDTIPPPAMQCQNGHLLCVNCRIRAEKCPVCRDRYTPRRALIAEQIYNAITSAFNLCRNEEKLRQKLFGRKPAQRSVNVVFDAAPLEDPQFHKSTVAVAVAMANGNVAKLLPNEAGSPERAALTTALAAATTIVEHKRKDQWARNQFNNSSRSAGSYLVTRSNDAHSGSPQTWPTLKQLTKEGQSSSFAASHTNSTQTPEVTIHSWEPANTPPRSAPPTLYGNDHRAPPGEVHGTCHTPSDNGYEPTRDKPSTRTTAPLTNNGTSSALSCEDDTLSYLPSPPSSPSPSPSSSLLPSSSSTPLPSSSSSSSSSSLSLSAPPSSSSPSPSLVEPSCDAATNWDSLVVTPSNLSNERAPPTRQITLSSPQSCPATSPSVALFSLSSFKSADPSLTESWSVAKSSHKSCAAID